LREYAKSEDIEILPESKSFFDKVAEFFSGSKVDQSDKSE